jgi:hypothetical protein
MHPLAAASQRLQALAPGAATSGPKSFHALGITHHFTAAQGAKIILFLIIVAVLALFVGAIWSALRALSSWS